MSGRTLVVLAVWLAALAGVEAWGQDSPAKDSPAEPSGYRMQDYRGPTPATLAGARVVTTAQAKELWKAGAIFVDVLPHVPRPANLPPGTIWREQARMPSAIWVCSVALVKRRTLGRVWSEIAGTKCGHLPRGKRLARREMALTTCRCFNRPAAAKIVRLAT